MDDDAGTRTTREIDNDLSEIGRARAWVRDQVSGLSPDQAEDVVLAADELISNALRHSVAPRRLHLVRGPAFLRVEVEDGSPVPATPREGTLTGGRGMMLVGVLAAQWGQRATGQGKVVWAEFTLA
ncbi:Anti-sigma regulatory factor (Ser/Thr protein kinase) [Lentzea fradiae]|uniref:Anti-sigma regulatory factor (Ser/Thr protein kinase) n=1 Tax=Lentzea fradiae TaxID=200378 RepID=A0A1G7VNV8_9PSEU|nr:Anti-sigma regulatory factor (Ser/Thr protein kinase) [Lentzea fradiae]